jgi:hypothetical protein
MTLSTSPYLTASAFGINPPPVYKKSLHLFYHGHRLLFFLFVNGLKHFSDYFFATLFPFVTVFLGIIQVFVTRYAKDTTILLSFLASGMI